MKTVEETIINFVSNFVEGHWDKINLSRCSITKSKEEFLDEVKTDVQSAIWVIYEVANWGMDKSYHQDIFVELPEGTKFSIWKLDDKFIKLDLQENWDYLISFVEPKFKQVMYFD